MQMPGPMELILILLIILLLFGAKRLPEIARSLGRAIKEFKRAGKSFSEDEDEDKPEQGNEKKQE